MWPGCSSGSRPRPWTPRGRSLPPRPCPRSTGRPSTPAWPPTPDRSCRRRRPSRRSSTGANRCTPMPARGCTSTRRRGRSSSTRSSAAGMTRSAPNWTSRCAAVAAPTSACWPRTSAGRWAAGRTWCACGAPPADRSRWITACRARPWTRQAAANGCSPAAWRCCRRAALRAPPAWPRSARVPASAFPAKACHHGWSRSGTRRRAPPRRRHAHRRSWPRAAVPAARAVTIVRRVRRAARVRGPNRSGPWR